MDCLTDVPGFRRVRHRRKSSARVQRSRIPRSSAKRSSRKFAFGPFFPASAASIAVTGTLAPMIRVLVTLSPRMYREAVALSIQRNRPGLVDVRLAPPDAAEAELASFRPHLLVHNDAHGDFRSGAAPIPEAALETVPHRLEVLYSDGMDVRISVDGRLTEVRDASTDDLLGAVDAASSLADQ
jgi:hypothetical protein